MKSTLKPFADRIIVRKLPAETTTPGGIIVNAPQDSHEKGYIVSVGSGRKEKDGLVKMTLKVGDTVLFPKNTGQTFKHKGEDLLIMFEADVVGIFT